jgi:hypothetical protein
MPHDERRNAASGTAVVTMDIASADTARFDLDQDIVWTEFGLGDIANLQVPRILEY